MGGIFSKPKIPAAPPPPPPPPTVDEAAQSSEASDKLRRRKGRASTILSDQNQGATTGVGTLMAPTAAQVKTKLGGS